MIRATGLAALSVLALASAGCTTRRTYDMDVASAKDFHWDGRLCVEEIECAHLGPLLTVDTVRQIDRVMLPGKDGRDVVVTRGGSDDLLLAKVQLKGVPRQILGTDIWTQPGPAPERSITTTEPNEPTTARPAGPTARPNRSVPLKDQLHSISISELLAEAERRSEAARIVLTLEREGLIVTIEGSTKSQQPRTIVVCDKQGTELKRFEEQPIPVEHK